MSRRAPSLRSGARLSNVNVTHTTRTHHNIVKIAKNKKITLSLSHGPQSTSYAWNTFLRTNDVKPFTQRNLLKILIIRSDNEKTRFRELSKLIFRFFFEHKVEWGVHLHKPMFLDQMSKYRASPPTYAHILLTTPQKHPWLASYQLWSRPEQAQAPKSRKTAQITFFHCQTHHFAVLPGPQSTSYAWNTFLRTNDVKPFTQCNLLNILIIRSGNKNTRFQELSKLIFRFFLNTS